MHKLNRLTEWFCALLILLASSASRASEPALDESLLVGRFTQCSYNAISSVMIHFYGPMGTVGDRETFEKDTFFRPLTSVGYDAFYGWGPWTSYMVNSGKMVWNNHPVTDLKAERFSLRPSADVQFTPRAYVVKYAPGERQALREKLLVQLAKGPVMLWTPYAAAQGLDWNHVNRVDDSTDLVAPARNTHSVALFLQPGNQVLVVDGSKVHGVFLVDPDVIVATSAAMSALAAAEDGEGTSIRKNRSKGVVNEEYNVVFIKTTNPPAATQAAGEAPSLQKQAVELAGANYQKTLPAAFERADTLADGWASAIVRATPDQRDGVAFLVSTMPRRDLHALSPSYIIEEVSLALAARKKYPWAAQVPDEIFRQAVLPYANLSESRERWRPDLTNRFGPLLDKCTTAGEAALALNRAIFPILNVHYHPTKRPRPDQSPSESIAAGFASCSGLSILLVDACRSIGVPARIVGTPLWFTGKGNADGNHAGNHTWVEIWDGQWHVLGASEESPLDQTWFLDNAKKQSDAPDEEKFRIFAVTPGGDHSFPMAWDDQARYVSADDVTGDYKNRRSIKIKIEGNHLTVKCKGRLIADLAVTANIATLVLSTGQEYQAVITKGDSQSPQTFHQTFTIPEAGESVILLANAK